jgi:hypothetical protein
VTWQLVEILTERYGAGINKAGAQLGTAQKYVSYLWRGVGGGVGGVAGRYGGAWGVGLRAEGEGRRQT